MYVQQRTEVTFSVLYFLININVIKKKNNATDILPVAGYDQLISGPFY